MPSLRDLRTAALREQNYLSTFGQLVWRIRKVKADNELSVADVVEEWCIKRPGNVALIQDDRRFTYGEMDAYANQVARWAQAQGVKRGDVVALLMANRPEYVMTWYGLTKMGATVALINNHLVGAALAHTLRISTAKHVIVGGGAVDSFAGAAASLENPPTAWISNGPGQDATLEGARDFAEAIATESDAALPAGIRAGVKCKDKAFYIYTSGTTGLPKAANITHLRALNMWHAFAAMLGSNESDRIYMPLPLYHATGGMGGVGAALTVGASLVIRESFSASGFFADIRKQDCTMFVYVGELCRYLVNSPVVPRENSHRIRACIGNGLRPEVWPTFRDRFKLPHIVEIYGSSEGNVAFFNIDDKVGSIGRLPPYMKQIFQVRVVEFDVENEQVVRGPDGRCILCPPGKPGEAIGRISETLPGGRFDGYNDPKATEKKILKDVFEDGDMWFRTGDLLSYDEDGFFYFVDRIGDTFRWKGENVATSEVAEVLSVYDGVAEANVYGVQVPGTDGRAGMAAIVPEGELDLEGLYAHLAKELAAYARPLFLRRQEAMEVTGTFKHRKVDLVKEGFDPSSINEPLFFRDDKQKTFVPLTPELFQQIGAGEVRV